MKRQILYIAAILSVAALHSCENSDTASRGSEEVTIYASIAESLPVTKTAIGDVVNNKVKYTWLAGDAINVFFGASESSIFVTNTTDEVAQFKGTIGAVTGGGEGLTNETSLWGVYPYDKSTTCDGSSVVMTLPHIQEGEAGNLADDLFPSIARSSNFVMSFYPVCGSIRFRVEGSDIVKVALSGNDGEPLAGKARVSMPLNGTPSAPEIMDGQTEVSMVAPDGGCFEPDKDYFFVIYPSALEKGFTITYYKKSSYASFTYNNKFSIGRNVFGSISPKDGSLEFTDIEGGDESGDDENDLFIPVEYIDLNTTSLTLAPNMSFRLRVNISPVDATDKSLTWISDAPSVAYVDDTGKVTAIGDGTATITASATDGSGVSASSTVTVKSMAVADVAYKDEYGVNHGYGTAIGDVVWAPVNCGYKAPTVDAQGNVLDKGYPYGKLYQWGRKYGQGYSLEYDSTEPDITDGPVSLIGGQNISNSEKFYVSKSKPYDWLSTQNDALWNSGTEAEPKKTEYDPCPEGWRVPTYQELRDLREHFSDWATDEKGQKGHFFSGMYPYQEDAPQVFFSAAGIRGCDVAVDIRGYWGYYWCSRPDGTNAFSLCFGSSEASMYSYERASGFSVRCVQE